MQWLGDGLTLATLIRLICRQLKLTIQLNKSIAPPPRQNHPKLHMLIPRRCNRRVRPSRCTLLLLLYTVTYID
jgi:hypothetical protein